MRFTAVKLSEKKEKNYTGIVAWC